MALARKVEVKKSIQNDLQKKNGYSCLLMSLSLQDQVLTNLERMHRQRLAGAKDLQLLVSCLQPSLSKYGCRRMRTGYASMHKVHTNKTLLICFSFKRKNKKKEKKETKNGRRKKTKLSSLAYHTELAFGLTSTGCKSLESQRCCNLAQGENREGEPYGAKGGRGVRGGVWRRGGNGGGRRQLGRATW